MTKIELTKRIVNAFSGKERVFIKICGVELNIYLIDDEVNLKNFMIEEISLKKMESVLAKIRGYFSHQENKDKLKILLRDTLISGHYSISGRLRFQTRDGEVRNRGEVRNIGTYDCSERDTVCQPITSRTATTEEVSINCQDGTNSYLNGNYERTITSC